MPRHGYSSGVRGSKAAPRTLPQAAAMVAFAIIMAAAIVLIGSDFAYPAPMQIYNLNASDVASVFQSGIGYYPVQLGKAVNFSGSVQSNGYSSVSVSIFNATSINNQSTYPQSISSSIFVTNSTHTAEMLRDGISNTLEQDALTGGQSANIATRTTDYSYGGANASLVTIFVFSAFNHTTPIASQTSRYPLAESLSAFSYGDIAGFVTTIGYTNLDGNYSVLLAERLFRHVVDSRPAWPHAGVRHHNA